MVRVIVGVAAWLAGTTLAVTVAWFGADTVLANTGMNPSMPVVVTAPGTQPKMAPSSASPVPSTPEPATRSAPTSVDPAPPSRTAEPGSGARSGGAQPGADQSGTARSYTLTGGHVTLDLTATSATLVTAVPDAGYATQTWSGTDWLRVDFSSGSQVSSLIASWNGHPPSITVTN